MTAEHIYRDWSNHAKEVIRPLHEYCKVEIFSFDHKYTKTYHNKNYTFKGENFAEKSHRNLSCNSSKDNNSHYTIQMDYLVKEIGDYRIDILYENTDGKDYVGSWKFDLSSAKVTNTNNTKISKTLKDITAYNKKLKEVKEANKLTYNKLVKEAKEVYNASKKTKADKIAYDYVIAQAKKLTSTQQDKLKSLINSLSTKLKTTTRFQGDYLKLDGEVNIRKRKTLYKTINNTGNHTLTLDLPPNTLFIGVIIRKIRKYVGDSIDSVNTNITLDECETTFSSETDPAESSFTILYSQTLDCDLTRSGFYITYMDEVNIYYRENAELDGTVNRRFGGYISTITLDQDRTKLSVSCSDRLQDGEHEYILDLLLILHGTSDEKATEYYKPINFNSYGEALNYLCNIYGLTLKSNIGKNYLVGGEVYNKGEAFRFGKKKDVKKVTASNMSATVHDNFITLRNNASGRKKQSTILFTPKKPIDITDLLTFHMTYGLGKTKTTSKSTDVETVDNSSNSAGSQKFTKCGVSQDGNYLMAIGLPSAGKDSKKGWTKGIFERKCPNPNCGSNQLFWDWNFAKGNYGHSDCLGNSEGSSAEGIVRCKSCDMDFSVQGWEHINGSKRRLPLVGSLVSSSKAEAQKLKSGKMSAVPKGNVKVSADNVLASIAKIAKQYTYDINGSSTYSAMKKSGRGDCHGFSDLIWTELKKYKVSCRIYEYATSYSSRHRSVVYKNAKNQWVSFPYKKYGLNRMLYPTSGLKINNNYVKNYKGTNIANVKSKSSNKSTQTSNVTTTKGYDKDKPINGYIQLKYSTSKDKTAKIKSVYLNFTQKAGTASDISGLSTVWVNNSTRKTSVDLKDWFNDNEPNQRIYLREIRFVAPIIKTTNDDEKAEWYTFDKSTKDYSSCKMDLYEIIFDDAMALNPTDLQSCGKSISDMLKDIVTASKYRATMVYEEHRCNDTINFSINNQTEAVFVASEGDNNNILDWTNITYSPVGDLRNDSICVFKKADGKYGYVGTSDIESILRYGVKTTLTTISEEMGAKQAYYTARNSKEYNPEEIYSYTIVVPYAPMLRIGDLIQVISNYKKLNDIKTVKSVKVSYKPTQIPHIQTEIGCDELEPFLRIRKEQEALRKKTRAESTYFSSTATPIEDEELYIWD